MVKNLQAFVYFKFKNLRVMSVMVKTIIVAAFLMSK